MPVLHSSNSRLGQLRQLSLYLLQMC
nr:unnamed protein product [Callosobruchus analis]